MRAQSERDRRPGSAPAGFAGVYERAIALAASEPAPCNGASNWSPLPPEVLANASKPLSLIHI